MDKIMLCLFFLLTSLTVHAKFLTVTGCSNCTKEEAARIAESTLKVNEVFAGQCFKDAIRNRAMIQTEGKSADQVASHLTSTHITVSTETYWTLRRVLGYTLPNQNKIWINRRLMFRWNTCDLGSLLAHESSHKAGYGHDFRPTKRRPFSVPYSVNYAFDLCCK